MKQRKATRREQIGIIQNVIESAIIQSAQVSGFRNWMIYRTLEKLKPGEWPDDEAIHASWCRHLILAGQSAIDPHDKEFFESRWYRDCDTTKGIKELWLLDYETQPL